MELVAWTRAVALGVVVLVPSLARADDPSTITVTLKNGAQYRGELVEKVPDDHVTLKLATGEVKTFPWAQIVDPSGTRPPAAETTDVEGDAQPALPPPASRARAGGTLVHIETDDEHVVLQRYAPTRATSARRRATPRSRPAAIA